MSEKAEALVEALLVSTSNKIVIVSTAIGSCWAWFTQNWVGFFTILFALLGFFTSWYYQHRRDRRESAESAARIRAIHNRREDDRGGS